MLGQLDTENYRGDEEEQAIANGEPESILKMKNILPSLSAIY